VPKTYRAYSPSQSFLLPPSPMDWLPEDHLAFFVLDVVKELDLRSIHAHYERDHRGAAPYDPRMMVALLLYAYCMGTPSSRRIERKTHEDVAFRVICGGQQPDHTRISEFRRIHLKALSALFFQVLRLCQAAGLVQLGHVAIDGTKVKANASKHKAMSYDRMQKAEAELQAKVKTLLAAAEKADSADDKHYGKGKRGDELPEELRRAESRLKKIQEAKRALEAEARARKQREAASKTTKPTDDDDDDDGKAGSGGAQAPKGDASVASAPVSEDLPTHKVPAYADGTPKPKAQRNFTDPESRIQKTNDGFVQGFNCQAAVDEAHQIIVGQAVTNQPPDVEHFAPMLAAVIANCGVAPATATADAGYYSEANATYAAALGVDVYIATGRTKQPADPPVTDEKPAEEMTAKERMTQKVKSEKGARIYSRRKCTVEPVFGQIKQARGFRQFLLRGVEKVRGEWSLICGCHNLLKLHRAALPA
jgi:transposase